MAITCFDIANQVFTNLNIDQVEETEFEAGKTKKMKHFNQYYNNTRQMILRDALWSFATAVEALSIIKDQPALADYQLVYRLPDDCLFARKIDKSKNGKPYEFKVVGKYLYCNVEQPVLIYTADITKEHLFDPTFVSALCHKIAALIAQSLKKDLELAAVEYQNYKNDIFTAQTQTQREAYEEPYHHSSIYNAMIS